MTKIPFLKSNPPKKSISEENKRKQKFAIWDYYKKKGTTTAPVSPFSKKKPKK